MTTTTTTATAMATRHFVEYLYPGFPMINVSSPKEIVEREVTELPEGAIGYRFFDGKPDNRENVSGRYYRGKKVEWQQMTEKLEATDDPYETGLIKELLLKMDGHDVVITKDDQMFRLYEGDTVI
ncbi:MAG: hypothetical protein HFJ19_01140 [Clostridia bacterium]|nr:hypothetical protein [Clostridia bacterium]